MIKTPNHPNAILSEEDVLLINDLGKYRLEIERKCEELVEKTKQECEQMRQIARDECTQMHEDAKDEINLKLETLSQNLQTENYEILAKVLHKLEHNYFEICNRVINKLRINTIRKSQIANIIRDELSQYVEGNEIKVSANASNIQILKEELKEHESQIKFVTVNHLDVGQCTIEDGVTTIYIDIKKAQEEISNILTKLRDQLISPKDANK